MRAVGEMLYQSVTFVTLLFLSACATNGSSPFQGSVAGNTSINAAESTTRCARTVGTLAVDESGGVAWRGEFSRRTQLSSIMPLIENTILQSNCFIITTQGTGAAERFATNVNAQNQSGSFRPSSANGTNQRIAADYVLIPTVNYAGAEKTSLGSGAFSSFGNGSIGGLLHGVLSTGSAEATLRLIDARAQYIIASSVGEGSASSATIPIPGVLGSGGSNPAARAAAAALNDAYNKIVPALVRYKPQSVKGGAGNGGTLAAPN